MRRRKVPSTPAMENEDMYSGISDERQAVVASGNNELEWNVDITDPALWWPRSLGEQPLVDVEVEVVVDGEVSDHRRRRYRC